MACFHPLDAWRGDDGRIRFVDRGDGRYLQLPCGQCVGCRLERSRQWAMRCMHEAQMHKDNAFVTLTYDQDHFKPSLDYRDFQLFMKRARKEMGPLRFICAVSMESGLSALISTLFCLVLIFTTAIGGEIAGLVFLSIVLSCLNLFGPEVLGRLVMLRLKARRMWRAM